MFASFASKTFPIMEERPYILKEEFNMLFEKKFKVVEIRDSGAVITHYLKGHKRDVKKDVEAFKQKAKRYEMVGVTLTRSFLFISFASKTLPIMEDSS